MNEEKSTSGINRRAFLGSGAKNAAGVAAGVVGLGGALAASSRKPMTSPNQTLQVGLIGVRHQGLKLARDLAAFPDVEVTSLCDVDGNLLAPAREAVTEITARSPRIERDFRVLLDDPTIDAVVIATPDHWHAPMAALAMQAGKDVYLEPPVANSVRDALALAETARQTRRIVQVGLQQRSGTHFRSAVDVVRSGTIGRVGLVKAWSAFRRSPLPKPTGHPRAPANVNYDLWLGPAAERPFRPEAFHYHWHWLRDFGTGELGRTGVHLLDVALWGLGDHLLPDRVSAFGSQFADDGAETPDTLTVQFALPETMLVWEHRLWSQHANEGRSAAVSFLGDKGTLIVDRGGWKIYGGRSSKHEAGVSNDELRRRHLRNFTDAIREGVSLTCDLAVGARSTILAQLGTISERLGREIRFDAQHFHFGTDHAANEMLTTDGRAPWRLQPHAST